jgi:hypothetical protein
MFTSYRDLQKGRGHLAMEACRLEMEPWRIYRPVVADIITFMRSRIRISIKVKTWAWIRIRVESCRTPAANQQQYVDFRF